jgi:hypothetical protein
MVSRKLIVLIVLIVTVLGAFHVGAQDIDKYLIVDLPDLGSVTYPMNEYSLRPASDFSVPVERSAEVIFPGFLSITPNDRFVAEQRGEGKMVYSVHFAAVIAPEGTTGENLESLLGKLPLVSYEAEALDGKTVAVFEHNRLPAVRVNGVTTGLVEIVSHILVLNGGNIIEILVTPAKSYAAPEFNSFVTGDADGRNLALAEKIWASLTFIP